MTPDLNTFTEIERSLLLRALDDFSARIEKAKKRAPNPGALKLADQNLSLIVSAAQKLHEGDCPLTPDEGKVVYGAIVDRRRFLNAALDAGLLAEKDRDALLNDLQMSNAVIRKLKSIFASQGIDIVALIEKGSKA